MAYQEHYEGNPITHEVLWETKSVLDSIEKLETDNMLNQFSTIDLAHQDQFDKDDDDVMMDCEQNNREGCPCSGGTIIIVCVCMYYVMYIV